MKYDFDKNISRENTNCVKYDIREEYFGNKEVMPMWVADMDFETPGFIRKAIIKRAKHPIYGYTIRGEGFYTSIINWMKKRHSWDVNKDWISFAPGIVPAINMAVLAFTKPGDKVIIQPPVYHPFFYAIKDHKREILENNLIHENGKYTIDYKDFEDKAKEASVFILCHPHNPVGRLWKRDELKQIIDICSKNNVLIFSDEIHSDLILVDRPHIPLLKLAEKHSNIISFYAPSKTFNLAGLSTSFLIIPDKKLKNIYESFMNSLHISMGNIFGLVALEAAYNDGEDWLARLLKYLNSNLDFLISFIKKNIPEIKVIKPEATYLVWLDFGQLKLKDKELRSFIIEEAGLGFNDGPGFGQSGSGFQRINIALPRKRLKKALKKLEAAIIKIR
ncbi:MAG: PatB family C-S lyase [Bacteroidales bacterium]|nr:PatB family C-S lyase [Bacteroidales bacterium]MCF8389369.1 PatB family C-S lyase [Bacteroidales bacterium]